MGFTGFYWVLFAFTGFYWFFLDFTGIYWVLLGFSGLYWVLQGFYWVSLGFDCVQLGFTGFYWVPLGFVLEHGHRLAHLLKRYLTAGRHRKPSSSMGLARQRRRSSGENVSCWNFYAGRFHHLPIGWPVRVGLGRLALVRFRSPQRSRSGRVGCAESKRNRPASGHDFIRPAVQLWKSAAGCRIPPRNPFRFLHLVWWFSFSFGQRWPNEWSQKLSAAVGRAHYGNSVLVRCWYERRAGWRASSFLFVFFWPWFYFVLLSRFLWFIPVAMATPARHQHALGGFWANFPLCASAAEAAAIDGRIPGKGGPRIPSILQGVPLPRNLERPVAKRIVTRFHWVLLGFTGFYWVLLRFTRFYWVFTEFYCVLLGFTAYYWVLPGFTGFYCVSLGFTGCYWVLLGFARFYWVLLGFTGFDLVLPSFTGFYWVLLGFIFKRAEPNGTDRRHGERSGKLEKIETKKKKPNKRTRRKKKNKRTTKREKTTRNRNEHGRRWWMARPRGSSRALRSCWPLSGVHLSSPMTYAPVSPPAGLLIGSRRLCLAVVSLLFFVLFLVVGGLFLRPFFLTWTVADGPQKRRLAIAFTALDRRVFGTFLLSVAIPFFFSRVCEWTDFVWGVNGWFPCALDVRESLARIPENATATCFWPIHLYWVLPAFTGCYPVLPGLTRINQVLLGFTGFLLGFTRFYWVLPDLTGFYWVLMSFTEFYWVLPSITDFRLLGRSIAAPNKCRHNPGPPLPFRQSASSFQRHVLLSLWKPSRIQ